MSTFEKLELFAENTNDINVLRDMFIEVISNNRVNLEDIYLDHKKEVDKQVNKDNYI